MVSFVGFGLYFMFIVKTTSGLSCFTETCHPPTTVCKVGFQHGYPSTGSCDKQHQHGNHPQCGHVLPDHGHCHCDDSFCVNLVYSLTTTAMPMPSTTPSPIPSTTPSMVQTDTTMAAPTTTQAPSSLACTDDEDALFTCQSYQDSYGLCSAAFGTLLTIAKIRCPKFCGLCGSNTQPTPTPSTVSGSSTLHPCLDHHVKCADPIYQGILCTATLQSTKDYAIATCPKSCNLCTEYFASLAAPVG